MNTEKMTAADFAEAMANSGQSGEDMFGFRQLRAELKRHPKVRERLAFEFLEITRKAIESGGDPSVGGCAFYFHTSITRRKRTEYSVALENIIRRLFKSLAKKSFPEDQFCPDGVALSLALLTLRVIDTRRFRVIIETLSMTLSRNSASELRSRILAEAKQSKAQMEQAIREQSRQMRKDQVAAELELAAHTN